MFSRLASSLLLLAALVRANSHDHAAADHNLRAQRLAKKQDGARVFNLVDSAEGPNFFDSWAFMTFDDPTHGLVQYVDRDTAFAKGLAYVRDDGIAVMRVDNTTWLADGQKRNSVRIHTAKSYGQGLFIADILQMPYGCSVWPAFWSNGANWPAGGEIDVIEMIHNSTSNQSTLHTTPGCHLDTSRYNPDPKQHISAKTFTGQVVTTNCDAAVDNNVGCGIRNDDPSSYGFGLNGAGGGVVAALWNEDGIRIWHFARANVPADIDAKTPNPDTWPAPVAFWSTDTCPTSQFFTDQSFIFNITLCGDLGNGSFNEYGCPGTCSAWVMDPAHFRTAIWKVKYFRVYQ
ncbi:SubName: Full=Related to endo-1,3(4)-beta-glucanase {ECO:0000313/EMBL:CCA72624.1} [Serendipita indica DSM 11827]|nr:SubName: Full=Related to endo-1,3(4)-beta-glucanase {ECO:0000313/EMBL:CCA72624.1} [Serendipita indica DSM 11827]